MASPKDFFELVKAIGESKSKQEEDRIISDEVLYLKKIVPQTGISKKKMKELVVRSLYVEMLGHDGSFAYIKAVELCASTSIAQKKVGYLAASLFLAPEHEFRFMLVNQIQRDLKSANMLEVATALTGVCKIVTEDMIPAVIHDVVKLLSHEMDYVRKRAMCAMHRLFQMDKSMVLEHVDKIRRALCDKDPSVMGATLPLFIDMIKDDVMSYKDLVPSFVSILKQITEHRLPRDFDYHRIPAPWIQMAILKILALLGRGDQTSSEGMYEVLADVMKRADTGINVGFAIVYQAVQTVTSIYPNTLLLDAAATSISRFIRSDSHNLRYIGIKGLAAIVKDHPRYAADHQMAVIDCLEDPDDTLKRKTLDLLFRMTNAVNVEFIVEKLLSFLDTAQDDHFRTELVGQITQCAERFAPSNTWYVQTAVRVFELAGDKVKPAVAQTLMQLIAEGVEEDEVDDEDEGAGDDELRLEAVESFLSLFERPRLPDTLAQCVAWVLGEYGYLSATCSKEEVMEKLAELAEKKPNESTRCCIVTALMKLVAQNGSCPRRVAQLVATFSHSQSLDLQQRCLEFNSLLTMSGSGIMADVLPVDASCEDIDIEDALAKMRQFAQNALNHGAKPYSPPVVYDDDDEDGKKGSVLNLTPYAAPKAPAPLASAMTAAAGGGQSGPQSGPGGASSATGPTGSGPQGFGSANSTPLTSGSTSQGNNLINTRSVPQVWGKKPEPAPAQKPLQEQPLPGLGFGSPGRPTDTVSNESSPAVASAAAAAPAPAPVASSEPPKPKVLSEKEKMAAALFGGMGTSGGAKRGSTANKRASVSNSSSNANSVNTTPQPPAQQELMGPTSMEPPAPHVPAAVAPRNVGSELLDMDLLGNDSAPAPLAAAAPSPVTTSPAVGGGDLDMFGGMQMQAPAAAPAPVVKNSISDAFGDMMLSPSNAPTATAAESAAVQPLVINTQQFGQRWGAANRDAKQQLQGLTHLGSLEALRKHMPPNYHHVESIANTQEAIFAATATNLGIVILVHTKLNPSRRSLDVLVKSSSADVSARELSTILQALSTPRM